MFGGGSRVHGLGGKDAQAIVDDYFELNYVPDPADEKARLALAFYREGLTLNSVAYQCLSFFKILNITLANSKAQKDWIDANIVEARKLDPHRIGVLDFNDERLDFEIFHHVATKDDGTLAEAQAEVDRLRFVDLYLSNGKLEIWSGNQRLSRKDAFIPVNVDLSRTHEKYEEMIAAAENVLRERAD